MAIIILGQSTCPLCGRILEEGQEVVGLPACGNESHDLSVYSDAGYHKRCYATWDRREELEKLIEASNAEFQQSEYFKKMLKRYGPPKTIEDQFVKVISSFKLSSGLIIVFLKWKKGKLANGTMLNNLNGERWVVKQYLRVTGSFQTYEKTREEEKDNIFQYLLDPISEIAKPEIDVFLKIDQTAEHLISNPNIITQ
jgi:hypothetical protein